jgi:hypothetical protein
MSECHLPQVHGQSRGQTEVGDVVNERPDRLEEIAAERGNDPDIRWLLDEVLRLRAVVDAEHAVALELAEVAIQRLAAAGEAMAEVISLLGRR